MREERFIYLFSSGPVEQPYLYPFLRSVNPYLAPSPIRFQLFISIFCKSLITHHRYHITCRGHARVSSRQPSHSSSLHIYKSFALQLSTQQRPTRPEASTATRLEIAYVYSRGIKVPVLVLAQEKGRMGNDASLVVAH